MALYYVQDDDRPMYVVASDWQGALDAWKEVICKENEITLEDLEETGGPNGIQLICPQSEVIVAKGVSIYDPLRQNAG